MAIYFLAGVIPAIFLVGIGQAFQPDPDQDETGSTWTGFLLAALFVLLAICLIGYHLGDKIQAFILMAMPAAVGVLAQTILSLSLARLRQILRSVRLLVFFLADLALLALAGPLTDPFVGGVILIGGLLLALAWLVWERSGRLWGIVYLAALLLGLYGGWRIDANFSVTAGMNWLQRFGGQLPYLAVVLEMAVLFGLLQWSLKTEEFPAWRRLGLAGLLALPVLGLAGWQIATSAAWDVATDGLGGLATLQITSFGAIGAAILTAWALPARRRNLAFILAMVLPIYMLVWMNFGTFGLDGPWGRVPIARTERRAASIERAIERYHQRNDSYPASLQELVPAYLLVLPGPFIIPGQDWCYQGGANFYRLGFVTRDFFSGPGSVRVFSAAGQPPDPSWPCEAEAARYPAPAGFIDGQ